MIGTAHATEPVAKISMRHWICELICTQEVEDFGFPRFAVVENPGMRAPRTTHHGLACDFRSEAQAALTEAGQGGVWRADRTAALSLVSDESCCRNASRRFAARTNAAFVATTGHGLARDDCAANRAG